MDNTYESKKGDAFAVAAAAKLGKVKGDGFRKEKTKKKRSTFFGGGRIDMGSNSFKFANDSD
eukprot:TRINITY_DN2572_c0_g1_i1.p3 TRINITY_DN2572_c0_g1~~TRINITY_DN2572_c0_g1_i1.p3  ORF type:complete len:62 (-),score=35.37 TRINITY_DN2572_c0_g1_i1:112-297(-)